MASTFTNKLNSGSMVSLQKYCVYIKCMQKNQSIIHLSSHPSTYLLDHNISNETDDMDLYLTVAARDSAVQERRKAQTAISSGHISLWRV